MNLSLNPSAQFQQTFSYLIPCTYCYYLINSWSSLDVMKQWDLCVKKALKKKKDDYFGKTKYFNLKNL